MKRHVILAGIAGTVLAAATASSAFAQARNSPDAAYCSQLSDAELVACQNAAYMAQLQSGASDEVTGPNDQTLVPGSNPADSAQSASAIVPGAETNPPLEPALPRPEDAPATLGGSAVTLPGPEGTISAEPE
jgi:hypothetical protein